MLVFYVEDATPACAAQLGAFRDDYDTLRDLGAQVLAVSPDIIEAHRTFAARERLPFALATDPDLTLARVFGVEDADNL